MRRVYACVKLICAPECSRYSERADHFMPLCLRPFEQAPFCGFFLASFCLCRSSDGGVSALREFGAPAFLELAGETIKF